ncbi:SBBP repeat-containing protein [Spirulina subsalsa]|uniref:DUF7948 domain-containing protein n=1 Tax=Spirulina subsalsa TaxID=54311 RepID=UPI000301857A|nr:SBBP repeat-containing protein [Spirulina subsalsa]
MTGNATATPLPLSFIANGGQTDSAIKFQVNGAGHNIFFAPDAVVFSGSQRVDGESIPTLVEHRLVGANPTPVITPLQQLVGVANFLQGNNPSQWITNVPTYNGIVYQNVYDRIDRVFLGTEGQLKSEFIVHPGGDPSQIRMQYDGVEAIEIRSDGALVLKTAFGELVDAPLFIYQEINGQTVIIEGSYEILENGKVGFNLGHYNPNYALVIDPTLEYSTYLGGSGDEVTAAIAFDNTGATYFTGSTLSTNFPTRPGAFQTINSGERDIFVTKVNPFGNEILYSTYIGGAADDWVYDILVDNSGVAYLAGGTNSTNFPITNNAFQSAFGGGTSLTEPRDAFLLQLNPQGNGIQYSTFFGGSQSESIQAIARDNNGNIIVVGSTTSPNFPTTPGAFQTTFGGVRDGFIASFDPTGTNLLFSTLLGGSGDDFIYDLAIADNGTIYLTGQTSSPNFPTRGIATALSGPSDAFVTALQSSGTGLVFSSYLGGSGADQGRGIVVDGERNIYVTGGTSSPNFFTTDNAKQTQYGGGDSDIFYTVYNPNGGLTYSTFLGGEGFDRAYGIAIDDTGLVYLTGTTSSDDLPTTLTAFQPEFGGGEGDAFFATFSPTGLLADLSYLGGSGKETAFQIKVDSEQRAYIAGVTTSNNFPTTPLGIQQSGGGGQDAFFVKVTLPEPNIVTIPRNPLLRLTEDGQTDSYQVFLTQQPTENVRIILGTDSQLNALGSLLFTPENWNVPQTVTVSAINDQIPEGIHNGIITHTVSDDSAPEYRNAILPSVFAEIIDNDVQYRISAQRVTIPEGDQGVTPLNFTIRREGDLTRQTSVGLNFSGQARLGVDYQNVRVSGFNVSLENNRVVFGPDGTTATLTLDIIGNTQIQPDRDIILTLTDPRAPGQGTPLLFNTEVSTLIVDDEVPGISILETNRQTLVSEDGLSDTYSIVLKRRPTANVVLEFLVDNQLQPMDSITFTPDNWDQVQTVTVRAIDDEIVEGRHTGVIQHRVALGSAAEYIDAPLPSLTVDIIDNDNPRVNPAPNGVFLLDSNKGRNIGLRFTIAQVNTLTSVNEIGVIRVDDEFGTVNGKRLGDPGYVAEALARGEVVFSALPNTIPRFVDTRLMTFFPNERLVFYLVQNSTTDQVLFNAERGAAIPPVFFSTGGNALAFEQFGVDDFVLSWNDQQGAPSAVGDVVMSMRYAFDERPPLGTRWQGTRQGEIIDTRGQGTRTVTINVRAEAAFNNVIGLYRIDAINGRIGLDISTTNRNYARTAIERRVTEIPRDSSANVVLEPGIYAPYLIANGTVEDWLATNPVNFISQEVVAYFPFVEVNPDGFDHLRMFGDNIFGFEDLPFGGDMDFNDMVFEVVFN